MLPSSLIAIIRETDVPELATALSKALPEQLHVRITRFLISFIRQRQKNGSFASMPSELPITACSPFGRTPTPTANTLTTGTFHEQLIRVWFVDPYRTYTL